LASILSGVLSIGIAGMVNGLKPVMAVVIGVTDVIAKLATGIVTGLANAFTFLINMAKGFAIVFKQIFTGINIVIKAVLNGLLIAVEAVLNFIIASINTLLDGINIVLDGIKIATFGAVDLHLDPIKPVKLTRLAEGGTVMPSPGGSIVNIAEAGKPERVVPLDSNGLSAGDKAVLSAIKDMAASGAGGPGIEINVYASEGMSVKDLAAEVSRQLSFSMRKGTI
jgi:phage-related protein